MSLFNNLFGCRCDTKETKDDEKIVDVKLEVGKTAMGCDMLKNATSNDIKALDTKFDLKFSMLSDKIDNIVMLITNRFTREV